MSSVLTQQPNRFSVHLDALRGLAALAVFAGHLRALFFVEFLDVAHPNLPIRLLYFLVGFGHQAVMIFFVLSGFLIASSVQRAREQKRWNWSWYAQNRLTRLYVVLLPALLLTALWDHLGMRLFGQNTVYGALPAYQHIIQTPVAGSAGLGTGLGNALFLQSILVNSFGSDSPLWSLSNEFWYYAVFPLCVFALAVGSPVSRRLGAAALAAALLALVGKEIALLYLVWLMGAGLAFLPRKKHRINPLWTAAGLGLLLAALSAARLQRLGPTEVADLVVGVCFSLFLYSLRAGAEKPVSAIYERIARFWSRISYTLYLVHVPILFFITAAMIGPRHLWQPDGRHLALGLVVAVGVFAYMLVIWRLTEANTEAVRRFLQSRLSRLRAAKRPAQAVLP